MTLDTGPDEKVCPFCAEVIRAAAIKCPSCRSDLPLDPDTLPEYPTAFPATGTAHDIRETRTDSEQVYPPVPVPAAPSPPTARPAASRPVRAIVTMLAACLFLVAGIVGIWRSAVPDQLRTAGNGQVTSTSYRSVAMNAAAEHAAAVLSYGYKTLDADEKAARAVLTAGYAKKYAQAMQRTGPKAIEAKLTLTATVRSTALISLKKGSAKVLLFVNTITTTVGSDLQHLNQNRVILTMTRKDGGWFVSNVDAF